MITLYYLPTWILIPQTPHLLEVSKHSLITENTVVGVLEVVPVSSLASLTTPSTIPSTSKV
jgi:hypothetical protein